MEMRHFWAQNGPFAQLMIFCRKHVNKSCSYPFIHACLHAKNETEPSLQPIDTEIVNGIPCDIMLDHPTLGLAMSVWRDGQNEFLMSELLTITLHHSIM